MKRSPGRKRPADAELLISQVKEVFKAKKDELGAEKAAKQIDVGGRRSTTMLKGKHFLILKY